MAPPEICKDSSRFLEDRIIPLVSSIDELPYNVLQPLDATRFLETTAGGFNEVKKCPDAEVRATGLTIDINNAIDLYSTRHKIVSPGWSFLKAKVLYQMRDTLEDIYRPTTFDQVLTTNQWKFAPWQLPVAGLSWATLGVYHLYYFPKLLAGATTAWGKLCARFLPAIADFLLSGALICRQVHEAAAQNRQKSAECVFQKGGIKEEALEKAEKPKTFSEGWKKDQWLWYSWQAQAIGLLTAALGASSLFLPKHLPRASTSSGKFCRLLPVTVYALISGALFYSLRAQEIRNRKKTPEVFSPDLINETKGWDLIPSEEK